jgi:hypothetical protein
MTADAGPWVRNERKTSVSEKLTATFDRGIARLMRGTTIAEMTSMTTYATSIFAKGRRYRLTPRQIAPSKLTASFR